MVCPSIVALDDGKVLALTGVDKVVGEGLAGCHKECNVSHLKIDVENLVESKRKDKSLPVQDSTTPIPGSYPSTPNRTRQSSYCGRVASPGTARCLSCPPSPVNTKWLGKASLYAERRACNNLKIDVENLVRYTLKIYLSKG